MNSLSVPKRNGLRKPDLNKEIKRLMDEYGDDVLKTSYMYLKDKYKAEDAFQEVFIKVYNKYGSFKGKSSEKTWIIRITINVCKDMLKSSWVRRTFLTDEISSENQNNDVESMVVANDENKALFNKVIALPREFKDIIILYYYHGYDTAEISEILDIPKGTVRSRLHRAREMLKEKIEGGGV